MQRYDNFLDCANFFEEKCRKSLFCSGKEELLQLLGLIIARENGFLVSVHRLAREALRLPFVVAVEDEIRHFLNVFSCESGVGDVNDLLQTFFVTPDTEYGFLDAQRLVELGSHDTVCPFGCALAGEHE